MALSPVRFLHAADLFLDTPLRDLAAGISIPRNIEQQLEGATLAAFERVVDAAIEKKVDFVILGGNAFAETDQSLAARIALLDGLFRLADEDIRVFVLPGLYDPSEAWREIGELPENVTVFFDADNEPVAVLRDGKVIATVAASSAAAVAANSVKRVTYGPASDGERRAPFAVVLLTSPLNDEGIERLAAAPADYLALFGPSARRSLSIGRAGDEPILAHHPGGTQGLSRKQSGPHGCSLVDVASDGKATTSTITTAVVVRESLLIAVDTTTDPQQFVEQMHRALCIREAPADDPIRIIDWQVRGAGPMLDAILAEYEHAPLIEAYSNQFPPRNGERMLHTFRIESGTIPEMGDAPAEDFFAAVTQGNLVTEKELTACLESADAGDYVEHLQAIIPDLDRDAIRARVLALGAQWFRSNAQGDSLP